METLHETIESTPSRSEQQRSALRNAMARRRLEHMRDEKDLYRFLTEVWEEPKSTLSPGR